MGEPTATSSPIARRWRAFFTTHRFWVRDVVVALGVGALIAPIVALGASLFHKFYDTVTSFWLTFGTSTFIGWQGWDVTFRLASVTGIAACLIILILWRWPGPLYSPAEVMLSAQFNETSYDHRRAFISTLVALIAVSAGGSVGQYGPLVIFGAAIACTIAQILAFKPAMRRLVMAAGAAAAISAAFDAPLGGIVFAHEVILRHYRLHSFATVSVASALAYGFSSYLGLNVGGFFGGVTGPDTMVVYVLLIIIGVLGGGLAVVLMRAVDSLGSLVKRLAWPFWVYPVLVAMCLVLAGSFAPQALGLGVGTIQMASAAQFTLTSLLLLIIIKTSLTAVCLAGGFYGGIVSPAMVVGAFLGGFVALLGAFFVKGLTDADHFILVFGGIGAVLAPVIGGPMTAIIIIYELTLSHDTAAAAALSVVFSSLVAQQLYGESFFVMNLKRRGFDLSLGAEERLLAKAGLDELVKPPSVVLSTNMTSGEALALFQKAAVNEAVLIDDDRQVIGLVTSTALAMAKPDVHINTISRPMLVLGPQVNQLEAIQRFRARACENGAFVDDNGCYVGHISASALLSAYAIAHERSS